MISTADTPAYAAGYQVRVKIPVRCHGVDLDGRVCEVVRVVDMSLPGCGPRLVGLEVHVTGEGTFTLFAHEVEQVRP